MMDHSPNSCVCIHNAVDPSFFVNSCTGTTSLVPMHAPGTVSSEVVPARHAYLLLGEMAL